ncbi:MULTISPECIES: hypothetical protein [unclassified Sphingobium]|uniref:hypothetical protein n=1 Tax=unclassified Sphingobium TaxID=2611147 RepID=UPI001E64B49B|nr:MULTISPECIES: hypothetical protein [unclassified Sphingobium]
MMLLTQFQGVRFHRQIAFAGHQAPASSMRHPQGNILATMLEHAKVDLIRA